MAETQEVLQERAGNPNYFDELYPIWRCPDCRHLNRFVDTFGERCTGCGHDFTLNWQEFEISEEAVTQPCPDECECDTESCPANCAYWRE